MIKSIKLSDVLKLQPEPFLCGAFLSRIMEETIEGKQYFYAYSSFRKSKFVHETAFDFKSFSKEYIDRLDSLSGHRNWCVSNNTRTSLEVRFYIENDVKTITQKSNLYSFFNKEAMDYAINGSKDQTELFIRGFFELRGSVDITANLLAQDYFYNKTYELKKALILTDFMNVPNDCLNFNARELQPDYVTGKSLRNTQLRMKLPYYAQEIGFVNKYKAMIVSKALRITYTIKNGFYYFNLGYTPSAATSVTFQKRVSFYESNVYGCTIDSATLARLRKTLGFDGAVSTTTRKRDSKIIAIFKCISPDECAICGTTKTYTKKDGKQYFEIHHVLPFKAEDGTDVLDNLVKLCPTCHRMLKKGSGTVTAQRDAIKKLLNNHEDVLDFIKSKLGDKSIDELAEEVQKRLE